MKTREVTAGKGGEEETENMMKRKEESRAVQYVFVSFHTSNPLFSITCSGIGTHGWSWYRWTYACRGSR